MIPVLVLAAGRARRFGSDKRQARLANGETVLQATLARVRAAGLEPRLVLAPGDPLLSEPGALVAPGCAKGMGSSIADAVAQLQEGVAGCLILPADMPFVAPESIRAVAAALADHAIVVPVFEGKRGHPVGFTAALFAELQALQGDIGARRIVARQAARVLEVAVQDPGILWDIDTPADLSRQPPP